MAVRDSLFLLKPERWFPPGGSFLPAMDLRATLEWRGGKAAQPHPTWQGAPEGECSSLAHFFLVTPVTSLYRELMVVCCRPCRAQLCSRRRNADGNTRDLVLGGLVLILKTATRSQVLCLRQGPFLYFFEGNTVPKDSQ